MLILFVKNLLIIIFIFYHLSLFVIFQFGFWHVTSNRNGAFKINSVYTTTLLSGNYSYTNVSLLTLIFSRTHLVRMEMRFRHCFQNIVIYTKKTSRINSHFLYTVKNKLRLNGTYNRDQGCGVFFLIIFDLFISVCIFRYKRMIFKN